MPLISCKIRHELRWTKICVIYDNYNDNSTISKIANTELYVPMVTLSTKDNVKLSKQLQVEIETK